MMPHLFARTLSAAAIVCLALTHGAQAQQQPSAAAVAMAREVIQLKGGMHAFDPVVIGVIEHHKNVLLQGNPTASRDLELVAGDLRREWAGRVAEVQTEVARGYASQFTEQELKDVLAFYKTPLGKKLIQGEPKALDEAAKRVDAWTGKFAEEVTAKLRAEMKKKGHNLL